MTDYAPSPAPNGTAPGWYTDPLGTGQARWWSGQDWTHHVHALPQPVAAPSTYGPPDEPWSEINLLVPRYKSLGVRSLVWGIVAFVLPVTIFSGILAVVYGAVSLHHGTTLARQGYPAPDRGMPIAGIVLGGLSLLAVLCLIAFVAIRPV